ncbi:MAG: CHAT domain-containing tetratricopeptide repeat protein [Acidobacteriota bacterium]
MRVLAFALAFAVCLPAQVPAGLDEARKLYEARDFERVERLCREQITALQSAGRAETLDALPFLNLLARAMALRGHVPEALPVAQQSLRIAEKLFAGDDPKLQDSLETLAFAYRWNGEAAQSRLLMERILAVRIKAYGPGDQRTLEALESKAADLFQLGNYTEAASIFSQVMASREKNPDQDRHRYVQSIMGLGMTRWRQNRLQEARSLLERALELRLALAGEWDVYTAATIHNLSLIVGDQGDIAAQLELQLRALRIREKVWGLEHQNVANGLFTVGMTQLRLGKVTEARASFERSLQMRRKTLGDEHRETGQSLNALAFTYLDEDLPRAVDMTLQAHAIQTTWLRANIRALSEREALLISDVKWGNLNLAINALRRPEATLDLQRKVWDAVVRARSLVLDEMMWRKSLPDQEQLAATRGEYSRKLLGGRGKLDAASYARELSQLRDKSEAAERELSTRNQRFREARQQESAGLEEVERALPAGAALISYVRYLDEGPVAQENRYGAFVLDSSKVGMKFVDLGSSSEIDSAVSAWRTQFIDEASSGGRAPKLMERASRTAGLALRRKIWDPLASSLKGASRIYVAFDGPLHLVSLGALPSGESKYLMETAPVIHYLNTERDLLREPAVNAGVGKLLVVGDPAFGAAHLQTRAAGWRGESPPCFDPSQVKFEALPSSGVEAREVLRAWHRAGGEGTLLDGARATQDSVEQSAAGKRVVHFATHGFFYRSRCGAATEAVNPLSLAGLALAGSNRAGGGLLTADKVLQLDLQGTEWAVLSGCDTGLGDTGAGEGVMGLRRAFQLAGARTVIMSLWPVEDASARRWMAVLYKQRLVDGLGTAEAVRAASLALLREARAKHASTHPLHWAPFVAAGDWR